MTFLVIVKAATTVIAFVAAWMMWGSYQKMLEINKYDDPPNYDEVVVTAAKKVCIGLCLMGVLQILETIIQYHRQ